MAEAVLAAGGPDVAISRAYYAMFYAAEALLLEEGKTLSKHSAVIAAFGHDYAKPNIVARELHHNFREAFRLRQVVDYDTTPPVTPTDARERISAAQEFLEVVEALLQRGQHPPAQ